MGSWAIRRADGSTAEVSGMVVRLGRGKKATDVLGIRKNGDTYTIDHIPSGCWVGQLYPKRSLARSIADQVVEVLGEEVSKPNPQVPIELRRYIESYQGALVDAAMAYEEWIHGPDAEGTVLRANSESLPIEEGQEDAGELWAGYSTLGWVPAGKGRGLHAIELRELVEGRPLSGGGFLTVHEKQGDG